MTPVTHRRRRRWSPLLAAALAVVALPFGARPAAAHAPRTPITARVVLPDTLPQLGETFEIRAMVASALDAPGTTVEFHASPGIRLLAGARPLVVDIAAGERRTFTATAVLAAPGDHSVGVLARRALPDGSAVWGDARTAYFHTAGAGTSLGFAPVRNGGVTAISPAAVDVVRTPTLPEMGLAVDEKIVAPEPPSPPPPGGTIEHSNGGSAGLGGTVSIGIDLTGRDPDNFLIPVGEMLGEIVNGVTGAHIAWFFTDASGYADVEFPDPGAFFVRWWAYMNWNTTGANNLVSVRPNNTSDWTQAHKIFTETFTGLHGGPWYLGGYAIDADDSRRGAFSILNDVNNAWLYAYYNGNGISPEGVEFEWQADSTVGTFYTLGGEVHLLGEDWGTRVDIRQPDAALHEYGHAVMFHVYGDYFPPHDCPSPHFMEQTSGPHCGWTEGWANFFAMAVHGDSNFDWPFGLYMDLEPPTWGSPGWSNGSFVEGRVAGALWDIFDAEDDGFDRTSSTFNAIWRTFSLRQETTFGDFYTAWRQLYDDCSAVAAIYQNTMDFDQAPDAFFLPDVSIGEDSAYPHIADLWAYANDAECTDEELTFEIMSSSQPGAGVSISEDRWLDIVPAPNFTGTSQIVLSAIDSQGKRWNDVFFVMVNGMNDPPDVADAPTGASVWVTDVETYFLATCSDPDGDDLAYRIDFGDGTISDFSDFVPDGGSFGWDHTFTSEGVYSVRVQVMDPAELVSDWSPALLVDVSELSYRYGNVGADGGGAPVAVLRVNGSSGDPETRVVDASSTAPLLVRLIAAPAGPSNPKFAVWGWTKNPKATSDRTFGIGTFCLNPLLSECGSRCPVFAASTIGKCAQLRCSTPEATGTGAGTVVLSVPAGRLPAGTIVTFQGLVKDLSDTSTPKQFSVTNAVVVRVGE